MRIVPPDTQVAAGKELRGKLYASSMAIGAGLGDGQIPSIFCTEIRRWSD
jgi:hypothetical protein